MASAWFSVFINSRRPTIPVWTAPHRETGSGGSIRTSDSPLNGRHFQLSYARTTSKTLVAEEGLEPSAGVAAADAVGRKRRAPDVTSEALELEKALQIATPPIPAPARPCARSTGLQPTILATQQDMLNF